MPEPGTFKRSPMKGTYNITVKNRRVVFSLTVERNITVIRGDSGTGKTTLAVSLQNYEELGTKSGVSVISDKTCHVLRGNDWADRLEKWSDSIVFIDEGNEFIRSRQFALAVRNSNNYYVLITRENLYQLPYAVSSVLELRKTTSRFKRTYNRSYPYYDHIDHFLPDIKGKRIITEDSNSGYDFFAWIADKNGTACIPASGKSGIIRMMEQYKSEDLIIVADQAAFGAEMENVYRFLVLHPENTILYLPESFEWLILKAEITADEEIRSVLSDPSDYIDSRLFFSWEQFFTDLLEKKTQNTYAQYHKSRLSPFYLQDENVRKILRVIEGGNTVPPNQ